ncbi:MAG: orotidine-5'-phosphate decarboxylase [Halothiobacillaceae bacterium]|nr:orotidine-5'-phosphate decarboxylase [Halothiobacillaceae bacterium]
MSRSDSALYVAFDYADPADARALIDRLDPRLCGVKIGKELFTAGGPVIVDYAVSRGFDVFLDLKFHDIPNTVAQACLAAARLGVGLINVHALGGRRMMSAAREALETLPERPALIAVTVLTSMERADLAELGLDSPVSDVVERLARLTHACGLDGVVCSAFEVSAMRALFGPQGVLVTPGVRPAGTDAGDQRRVATPAQALKNGASHLVIGRPITRAADPRAALEAIRAEMSGA